MLLSKTYVLFVFCGSFATFVNILSRWFLNLFMPFSASVCVAYLFGMLIAFFLFKFVVFQATVASNSKKEILCFIIVNLWGLFQTLIISLTLLEYVFPLFNFSWHSHEAAHVLAVSTLVVSSYWGHKILTFRKV